MFKTISYFPIKPITRIALLKPSLGNAFTNLNIIEKDKFKSMILSVMREKPLIKKKKPKKQIKKKIISLFLYEEEEKKKEEKEEKEEKEVKKENKKSEENNLFFIENKQHINAKENLKMLFEKRSPKRRYSSMLFNDNNNNDNDRKNKNNEEKDEIRQNIFQKIEKKNEKNFNKYINEDNDYYYDKNLKLIRVITNKGIKNFNINDDDEEIYFIKKFEEINNRKKKLIQKYGDINNFEKKFNIFKDEIERLKKLSDEDFIIDTLSFINKDIEVNSYNRNNIKNKYKRINQYKDFIKGSKERRNGYINYYKSHHIIFKPSCEFNTGKIYK